MSDLPTDQVLVRPRHARRWPAVVASAVLAVVMALVLAMRSARSSSIPDSPATDALAVEPPPSPRSPAAGAATPTSIASATQGRIALGKAIFFDPDLSEPRGTSCASCHDPGHGYAGNNGSLTGVARGSRPGHFSKRNTPSVLYLKFIHRFHVKWEEDAPLPDAFAGFFWDGRADSIAEVVREPLLDPDEMNNRDARQVADKIAAAPYSDDFRREFGDALGGARDPSAALAAAGTAVEAFLTSPEMSPFSSRYDDFVRGRSTLTPVEARGLTLFRDRAKGACDGCHQLAPNVPIPERSIFTGYRFDAVGVPRNRRIPANADPNRYDLGLCAGPRPKYHSDEERLCGSFRTPSLRNVAARESYMHNGVFTSLRDVVAFYATRGTHPARWYGAGTAYDDVPARYRGNVNVNEAPYDRGRGEAPRLDDQEIDAIVAFLRTLTDADFPASGAQRIKPGDTH